MGISSPRDLDVMRAGFVRWLRTWRPDARDVRLAGLERPTTGLSSETLFLEVDFDLGDREEHASLVGRLPPNGEGLFPSYDLRAQGELQSALAAVGVPAVTPVAIEDDDGFVGDPFLLMPRLNGRVVRADLPYLRSGWLAEATPHEQARLHGRVLEVLAAVHRVDWRGLGLDRLVAPEAVGAHGAGRLADELARWARYLEWAGEGAAPAVFDDAVAWCRAHLPARQPPASLLWGDPQLGNVLVDDTMDVAAILDFELASIGPAEIDLAWFCVLHDMTVARCGGDLPGFPGRSATVAAYERHLGRPVTDLRWYEVFAALRSGAVMVRAARLLARLGVDDSWLTRGNPTVELLGELMAGS
jgi:aminoglycoside phosphotransferase (APT) family kinase protein